MQALLEQIKPTILPATYEPPETSNALRSLLGQVETRQWQKFMLEQLEFEIMALDAEITEYQYYKKDKTCLLELQLGVERYGGTRGPWCLNYQMEEYRYLAAEAGDPDPYPDCPKAADYKIGCYRNSSQDTIRFIKDRLAWAIKFTEKRFKAACKLVKVLETWDVRRGIPEVSWIAGMIDELAGNPTFFGVNYDNHKKPIHFQTV